MRGDGRGETVEEAIANMILQLACGTHRQAHVAVQGIGGAGRGTFGSLKLFNAWSLSMPALSLSKCRNARDLATRLRSSEAQPLRLSERAQICKKPTCTFWFVLTANITRVVLTTSEKTCQRRLAEHNAGEGANYTRKFRPVKLVYLERFSRLDDAYFREKQVQGWSRKKKEALINGESAILPRLSRNSRQNRKHGR